MATARVQELPDDYVERAPEPTDYGDPVELDDTDLQVELDEDDANFVKDLILKIMVFMEDFTQVRHYPYQAAVARRILESIIIGDGEEISVLQARQCLDGDTIVYRRDGTACRLREHEDAWSTGVKLTKKYRVRGGNEFIATDNHPVWTPRGWVSAGDLVVGDKVAVLADEWKSGWGSGGDLPSALLLGYMLTDGTGWHQAGQSPKFTNINPVFLNEVECLLEAKFGFVGKKYAKGNGYDLIMTNGRTNKPNQVGEWLRGMSWDHKFPVDVFSWDRESVSAFVKAAWCGDGYVSTKMVRGFPRPEIGLACGNDRIYAQYWQALLRKAGIATTLKSEWMSKSVAEFHRIIVLPGMQNVHKFMEFVGDIPCKPYGNWTMLPSGKGSVASGARQTVLIEEWGDDGEPIAFRPIISIEDAGEREVFDVSYPGKGWFVANGVKVHNSGKSEVLANVIATCMVLLPALAKSFPRLLGKFANGFMVGCFAPSEEQAETVWLRVVDRLSSPHAKRILADPEIDDEAKKSGSKAKAVRLKNNGSLCRMQTCNPKAKIESKTYHFVLVDECQDGDDYTITKSIHPMLAFNLGTIVKTGTPNRNKGNFYKACARNKRRQTKSGSRQNHFQYDYRHVCKYNANYRKYIAKERERIGEDSDEFQMSYCVSPSTRILTADLRYILAGDVAAGMKLVGFDEERTGPGLHRQFRETEVLAAELIERPCYEIELDDGTKITCSAEHRWLVSTAGRRTEWMKTEDLTKQRYATKGGVRRIFRVADVWDTAHTYESGYLAAAFDGEGCLGRRPDGKIVALTFAQKDNAMLTEVRKCLDELGYEYSMREHPSNNGVIHLTISGGQAAIVRFLGEVRPHRLLGKFSADLLGSIGRHDHAAQEFSHPAVVSTTFVGMQPVMAIKTDTKTYVAEGLASHNCCKWLLEQGMFTTDDALNRMGDIHMSTYDAWFETPVVVGIDPARSKDSTVVTVVWVNWDRPDAFGYFEHRILAWLEINNKDWEDQYAIIFHFLSRYNILRIGVDANGMGGPVASRMKSLFPRVEVVECQADNKAQSARWKHLKALTERRGCLAFPARHNVRKTRCYKRFIQQMAELEVKYVGQYMTAAAPEENDAHDDYCDSLALACYMTIDDVVQQVEVIDSPFVHQRR